LLRKIDAAVEIEAPELPARPNYRNWVLPNIAAAAVAAAILRGLL
jgi:hypothetical protein